MFKYLATACAVKFLVRRLDDSVPIQASLSVTSKSLGYELILAMCYEYILISKEPLTNLLSLPVFKTTVVSLVLFHLKSTSGIFP